MIRQYHDPQEHDWITPLGVAHEGISQFWGNPNVITTLLAMKHRAVRLLERFSMPILLGEHDLERYSGRFFLKC